MQPFGLRKSYPCSLVCEGIQGHYDHFVELNKHFKSMQVDIDSIDWQKAGDRIYLHYLINAIDLNNQASKIYVMGYMVVKNEKIVLFNEIIHKESTLGADPVCAVNTASNHRIIFGD